MEYTEFIEILKEEIVKELGDDLRVSLHSVIKNNSVELQGLSIVEKDMNISPTIYINDYFKEYKNGRKLKSIVQEIIKIYEDNRISKPIDIKFFTEFTKVKEKIVFKLINYEKNHTLLQEIPYIQFLDLAIVFYCLVSSNEMGNATILVHNNHMDMWKTDINELYSISQQNTPRILGCQIRDMDEIMREILYEDLSKGISENDEMRELLTPLLKTPLGESNRNAIPMFVLSNKSKINGASCLLYHKVLEEFSNRIQRDFYILPSSVHEVIFVPADENYSKNQLVEMVKEVNMTQVQEEEILSDAVYYYSQKEGKVTM